MTLTTRPFQGSLDGAHEHIIASLRQLGEHPAESALVLVGPFPVFQLNAAAVARGSAAAIKRQHFGWRGLITSGGKPTACVDFPAQYSRWHTPAVRGSGAARALAAALDVAGHAEKSAYAFDVRVVQIPRLYVTALWLKGPLSAYIPTRAGSASRPAPQALRQEEFIALVRGLLHGMQSPGRLSSAANTLPKARSR